VPSVSTLTGDVDVADLGVTLMHEHLFVVSPDLIVDDPVGFDADGKVTDAVAKLTELAGRGVQTIVDPTVIGLGRDIRLMHRIAEQVDVTVVPATGVYTYRDVPFPFRFHSPDWMVDFFVRDITEGIGGTDIRAAFLKCAVDMHGLTDGVETVLRSVAKAHHRTGVPITVHTSVHNEAARLVKDVLTQEGVDPGRVVLGHVGDSEDLDLLTELAEAGYYLGMDRFGVDVLLPLDKRVATVAEMCARGYAERLVLAHDANCHSDWFPPEFSDFTPNWRFTHIPDEVLPALRERGVSEEHITTMLVDNPRRYFAGDGR
jgi:phosphotriesterase-related protein